MTDRSADVVPMLPSVEAALAEARANPGKPFILFVSGAFPKGMVLTDDKGQPIRDRNGNIEALPEKELCGHCEDFEKLQRENFRTHTNVTLRQIETYLGDSPIPGAVPQGQDFDSVNTKLGFDPQGKYNGAASGIEFNGTPALYQLQADKDGKVHIIAQVSDRDLASSAAFGQWLDQAGERQKQWEAGMAKGKGTMGAALEQARDALAATGGGSTVPQKVTATSEVRGRA